MANQMYANVAKVEFDAYCAWIAPELKAAADNVLPNEIVQIFMEYIMPDEAMHFEAVIRFRPRLFRFAHMLNDVMHQEAMAGVLWRIHKHIYQSTVEQFNHSMIEAVCYSQYLGGEKTYRVVSVTNQFKKSAAQIMVAGWPICDSNLRVTGSNGWATSETKYCASDLLVDRMTRISLNE